MATKNEVLRSVILIQPEKISFERTVNLRYLVDGQEGFLKNHFEHHAFNQGIDAWIGKHRSYAAAEAIDNLRSLNGPSLPWSYLVHDSPTLRRRALKELSFRLPLRPALRFLYMYLFRLGLLDGRPGLDYCLLLSLYERMIVLKMKKLRHSGMLCHSPS